MDSLPVRPIRMRRSTRRVGTPLSSTSVHWPTTASRADFDGPKAFFTACAVALLNWGATTTAFAQETFCDASVDNCRVPLVSLIDNENVGIDMAASVIKDGRIPAADRTRPGPKGAGAVDHGYSRQCQLLGQRRFISDMINAGVQMRPDRRDIATGS